MTLIVNAPPVHADPLGVPQHPNIAPYLPDIVNVALCQNNVSEMQDPIRELSSCSYNLIREKKSGSY